MKYRIMQQGDSKYWIEYRGFFPWWTKAKKPVGRMLITMYFDTIKQAKKVIDFWHRKQKPIKIITEIIK